MLQAKEQICAIRCFRRKLKRLGLTISNELASIVWVRNGLAQYWREHLR